MTQAHSKHERFKAFGNVFDESTIRAIFTLSSQHVFDDLKSPISIGKEANVFSATKGEDTLAVKIYRTSANFKKMYEYMAPDPRFSGLKKTKMNIILMWAKKEYRNLMRARAVRINVPTPVAVLKNLLVMEFIGEDNHAAPQLIKQNPEDPEQFFQKTMEQTRKLYQEARLIHADLSAFNILNHNEEPVLIDFSHAIDPGYPNSAKYLKRDIDNVCAHFNNKLGLQKNPEEEYKKCTAKN